jgi:hypothetical protein
MRNCYWFVALAMLLAISGAVAHAEEYNSLVGYCNANGIGGPGGSPPSRAYGTQVESWNPGIGAIVGLAYDPYDNGVWVANESTSFVYLVGVGAGHPVIRQFNVAAYGLTMDGFSDGVCVDGNRLLIADYQGDLTISDDIIYSVDRVTGALLDHWILDGAANGSLDGSHINTIIDIAVAIDGTVWATDFEGNVHNINLMPGGSWTQNSQQGTGTFYAGIDYDACLDAYFIVDFLANRVGYHSAPTNAPSQSFTAAGPSTTAVTSDRAGFLYVSGFGDNIIRKHEGIECATPVQDATWGIVKSLFR